MYSAEDVEEIARVIRLARDLGVNLAGIEIILKMRRRMLDMQAQIEESDQSRAKRHGGLAGRGAARHRAKRWSGRHPSQLSPVDLF